MKVMIAAGGSGGHIFPAVALGRAIKRIDPGSEMLFIGSRKSLDVRIFEKERLRHSLLSAGKLPYRISFAVVPFSLTLLVDLVRALGLMISFRPDVVVGFGGYVSFPVVSAARISGVPSIIHEQNVVPGRANAALFKIADRIAISFEETRRFLGRYGSKAVFVGNPIRVDMFRCDRSLGVKKFGFDANAFTVLVIGGSQGSHALNRTFVDSIFNLNHGLRNSLQVIHITGVKDYEWALGAYAETGVNYRVHSFIDRIEEAYGAADLVITRSGSSAIFELAFLGKPMILVPYPFAMSHQKENALVFSKRGAAIAIDEDDISADIFSKTLTDLFNDRPALKKLGQEARRLSVPGASDLMAQETVRLKRKV